MKTKRGISLPALAGVWLLMAAGLAVYSYAVMGMSPLDGWRYWTREGNFRYTVLVVGGLGLLAYKGLEHYGGFRAQMGAIGAMLIWFLTLMALKFAG